MLATNAVSAVVLIPALLIVAPRFGGPGAAAVWMLLNAGYLIFSVPLMHRRLLKGELGRWYRSDVLLPAAAAVAVALAGRVLLPPGLPSLAVAAWMAAVGICAAAAAASAASSVRVAVVARLGWSVS
jgi:hypothetical protein